jgi:hypothetical protein
MTYFGFAFVSLSCVHSLSISSHADLGGKDKEGERFPVSRRGNKKGVRENISVTCKSTRGTMQTGQVARFVCTVLTTDGLRCGVPRLDRDSPTINIFRTSPSVPGAS